jgi:hypothetical protein
VKTERWILPEVLRVGTQFFTIQPWVRPLGKFQGDINMTLQRIRIWAGLGPEEQVATLLHELIHAFLCRGGLDNLMEPRTQEAVANAIASGLLDLATDNESFVECLAGLRRIGLPVDG